MKYLLATLLPLLFFTAQIKAQRLPNPDYTARKIRSLAEPSVFQKEIDGEVPERIAYQDSLVTVVRSFNPQLPVHLIMVPNRRIPTMNDATEADQALLGHMLLTASKVARQEGIAETGYRLAFNTNEDAGQSAFHLHLHILGGAKTGAMVDQGWRNVRRRLADSTHTTAFEKRMLGTWTAQNSTESITMKWEPDLQNKFLLQTYRRDTRISPKETEVYENKAFYKATGEPGHFTSRQMDSNGEFYEINAEYDGQAFTAYWFTPKNQQGKTIYRFLDDQTIEISEYRKDEKGDWRESNVNILKKM